MASVFLSYDRDDLPKAQSIAVALEKAGHSVWWDRHIKGGAQYAKEIERALRAAEAVVVLWSEQSVESAWVRDEAAAGRDTGRFIPVALDRTEAPLGFRQFQTIDLSQWKGRKASDEFKSLLEALNDLSKDSATNPVASLHLRSLPRKPLRYWWVAIPLIVLVALLFWKPWSETRSAPIVAVGPAEANSASTVLARDLFIKLGELQSAKTQSMQLVEQSAKLSSKADLILQAGGGGIAPGTRATLLLLAGGDRTLLWSKEFQAPAGNTADLNQQLAHTAGQILMCALEAVNTTGKRLDKATRSLYLKGCAQQAELMGTSLTEVIPIFLKATENAPWFEPGWAKLLWAEANSGSPSGPAGKAARAARVREHIVQARKLNPTLAEAVLAEASLLPRNAPIERIRLLERALADQPSNANLLASRSGLLGSLGRWKDAVEDARRASQLEPLSPGFRHTYILTLAYSGQTGTAFAELAKAERLWPGATNMIDARFRLHFRYGDPREAQRLIRVHSMNQPASIETILAAKANPTAENVERARTLIRNAVRDYPNLATGPLQGFPELGIEGELHDIFSRWDRFEPDTLAILFRPAFRNFQKDPRFMQLAARSGLIRYWAESGKWPDFCFDPDLPYDCKAEAAKLAA